MPTYAVFMRAVNVGQRRVTMARVRDVLSDNGFTDVVTHINSGNVRVATGTRRAAGVASSVGALLSQEFGFDIPCVARPTSQLARLADEVASLASPLGEQARTYVCILASDPVASAAAELGEWDVEGERAAVLGAHVVLWLTTPAHSCRLTNARLEKITGRVGTTRDLKVLRALGERWS